MKGKMMVLAMEVKSVETVDRGFGSCWVRG